jgi:hypothetical protein
MERYNIFNKIHKALRAMLYDTALQLQQTDFAIPSQARPALERVEQVNQVFHSHAEHEDRFVLPAIAAIDPSLVNELESEHDMDEALSAALDNLVTAYNHAADNRARADIGYALLKAFNEFVAFNLYHMNKEENKINRLLWDNFTDKAILSIERDIVTSIPPQEMEQGNRWMMRGISNSEICTWLLAVKAEAPDFVFSGLLDVAEDELPAHRWSSVQESLAEGALSFS